MKRLAGAPEKGRADSCSVPPQPRRSWQVGTREARILDLVSMAYQVGDQSRVIFSVVYMLARCLIACTSTIRPASRTLSTRASAATNVYGPAPAAGAGTPRPGRLSPGPSPRPATPTAP